MYILVCLLGSETLYYTYYNHALNPIKQCWVGKYNIMYNIIKAIAFTIHPKHFD